MYMRIFNACTKVVYNDKEGKQKTIWYRAGTLKITEAGKMFLRLFHQPEVEIYFFEQDQQSDDQSLPVIDADKE